MRVRYLLLMIAEHASTRVLDALTTLILIRALDVTSLGAFVVYQSWVAIFLLGFPALENMLYREYGRYRSAGSLGRELAVYRKFNVLKLAAAVVLVLGCSALTAQTLSFHKRLAAMTLAFSLPLAQALYGIYRETLRFELRPGSVVLINAAQRLSIIAAVFTFGRVGHGAVEPIAAGATAVYVVFGGVWALALRVLVKGVPHVAMTVRQALPKIIKSLTEAVLWLHLNGAIFAAVQTLDVYFLSQRRTPIGEIAVYSIALKAANFFQIIPLPFAQALGVYFGRKSGKGDRDEERRLVFFSTLLLALLALLICVAGFAFSDPILAFLAKGKFSAEELARASQYFRWMVVGVAILSLSFGVGPFISSRGSVRGLSLTVMLPWLAISALGYLVAAGAGPLAAAKFNVPVAVMYSLGSFVFFLFTR